jgi:hypothetical protein
VNVHLAAEGLDEVPFHGESGDSCSSRGGGRQMAEITPFAGGIGVLRATSRR